MYYYYIEYIDELEKTDGKDCGLIAALSYGEAANKVVEYYGVENTISIQLTELNDLITIDELKEEYFKNE